MTTRSLTGFYGSGYTITSGVTGLYLTPTAYVGGAGLVGGAAYCLVGNNGTIKGGGVSLKAGGEVYNGEGSYPGALIKGRLWGIDLGAAGDVHNYGVIENGGPQITGAAAVIMQGGGRLINGSYSDTGVLIQGSAGVYLGASGTVMNYGAVVGQEAFTSGVGLHAGGRVVNGTADDTTAAIRGGLGVYVYGGSASVVNFGSIESTRSLLGVMLRGGGYVVNGTAVDTAALIRGAQAVECKGLATVSNFATIESTSAPGSYGYGVALLAGGTVTNGSLTDRAALIEGYRTGVESPTAVADVYNFATIAGQGSGTSFAGVKLYEGVVVNGAGGDHSALIEGYSGVLVAGPGLAHNFGTILGVGGSGAYAVELGAGSEFLNGAVNDTSALVSGFTGVDLDSTLAATNYGDIVGTGVSGGFGAFLNASELRNGGRFDHAAAISGFTGAMLEGGATLTNYGAIAGLGGIAVDMTASNDTLVVEAGSAFAGAIYGGGGTLELASGVGTLTGLLAGGAVTVSGSMAATTFKAFGSVQIDAGASFTLAGTGGTIGAGQALTVQGTLAGTGTLALAGGTANFGTGANLAIAKVSEAAGSSANFNANLNVADVWTQTGGAVSVAAGDRVNFTGTGDSFADVLTGAGAVYFFGGTDALTGATLSATTMVVSGGAVTLSGTIDLTKTLTVTSPSLTIAAGGATLSGGGVFFLSTAATSAVIGASAAATLANFVDTIEGAGQLGDGQLSINNAAAGVIKAELTTALTINTGTGSFSNAGTVESTNTGGLTITGAVTNTGFLIVEKGTLTVDGAVTGNGTVHIGGGVADFAGAFTENVTFTGTAGVLELAHSQTYAGHVTGLSTSAGGSTLDLLDIGFTSATTKATFSGTTASGTLTVTDGTHTAHITLIGNYVGHSFTTASDGHGGTTVSDPAPSGTGHVAPLVSAMASFGAGNSAGAAPPPLVHRQTWSVLAAPG
jgi:hypothetical protein